MKKILTNLLFPARFGLTVALLLIAIANIQATNPNNPPLADFLNPDGSINLQTDYRGSVNLAGFSLMTDECLGMVAVPNSETTMPPANEWSALGSGLFSPSYSIAFDGSGNLYAGGEFGIAGGISANRIAKWDGSTWSALGSGLNSICRSLAIDGSGNLYAGGQFTTAGGTPANRIAKWDGSTWSALGSGLNSICYSIAIDGSGNLYAGGEFAVAGGISSPKIAKWDGSTWSALGSGLNGICYSLAFDGSGNLYAGGEFWIAGGISANRIAKWDGSTWSALGSGLNDNCNSLAIDGSGNLYAGGQFTTAGGISANRIAKWDGSTWSALGSGLSGICWSIAIDGSGNLYAGGYFGIAGGTPANRIAKWDGSTWSALGSGLNSICRFLAIDGSGNLYAGGLFTTAGGTSANRIAKWGLAAAPEINLTGLSNSISDGNTTITVANDTDFGDLDAASGTDTHTFTIENTGTGDLTISSITIDNTTDFSMTQAVSATVAPSGNTTFEVTFDPVSVGPKTATITINNDDADEGTYTFVVGGNGLGPIESIQTGEWTDPTTWVGNVVPAAGDDVLIKGGHTVTVPDDYSTSNNCDVLSIEANGQLTIIGDGTLNCDAVNVAANATLELEESMYSSGFLNVSGVLTNDGLLFLGGDGSSVDAGQVINNGNLEFDAFVYVEADITNNGTIKGLGSIYSSFFASNSYNTTIHNYGYIYNGTYDWGVSIINKAGGNLSDNDPASSSYTQYNGMVTNELGGTIHVLGDDNVTFFDFTFPNAGDIIVDGLLYISIPYSEPAIAIDATNLDVQQGGWLELVENSVRLTGASFANNGLVTFSEVQFEHTGPQTINGTGEIEAYTITLNNANNLSFPDGHTLVGDVQLDNGKILIPGTGDVVVNNGSVIGADSDKYFVTSSTGKLVQSLNGSTAAVYPIGPDVNSYNPVTVQRAAGSTGAADHGVRIKVAPDQTPNDPNYVNLQWDIDRMGSTDDINVMVQWNSPADETAGFDANSNSLSRWDGSQWVKSTVTAASCANGICTRTENDIAGDGAFIVENAIVTAPEIDLTGLGTSIPSGSTGIQTADDTDFGDLDAATGTDTHTFTIENTGTGDLTISSITIDNTTDFSMTQAVSATVAPSGNTTFEVTFDPVSVGAKTATVTINNDDADEGTYTFAVGGNGVVPPVRLWGTTEYGGASSVGAIISINSDGTGFESYSLSSADGGRMQGSLIEVGGKFYGLASSGGDFGGGVLFEYDPSGNGTYTAKHHFEAATGSDPRGDLLEVGGKFYGMTAFGGLSDPNDPFGAEFGVLFEYDPCGSGQYTVLHYFDGVNGQNPWGSCKLLEADGKFYGTTGYGGSSGGVLFEYDPSGGGVYTVKHDFDFTTGYRPFGGLIEVNGKFYGAASAGGSASGGVLYEYNPSSEIYTVIHNFDEVTGTGRTPYCNLLEIDGKFYGTAFDGGTSSAGVLFEYDLSGSGVYTVLHNFQYSTTGGDPWGSLTEVNGKFYGTGRSGGSSNGGVLFEYDSSAGFTVLKNLETSTGKNPAHVQLVVEGSGSGAIVCAPTCDISITDITITNQTCAGEGDGTVTITASCTTCAGIQYSIDGGVNFFPTGAFTNVAAGSIDVVVEDTGDDTCQATDNTNSVGTDADNTPPTITCPADQVQNITDFNTCSTNLGNYTSMVTVSDNCGTGPVTQWPPAGWMIGTQTVTMTVSDFGSNQVTCEFTVTTTNPNSATIVCPSNQTEIANASCEGTFSDYTDLATVSGTCLSTTVTQDVTDGASFTSPTTVTLTATTQSNVQSTCTFDVSVEDNTDPMITCPTNQVEDADANCLGTFSDYTSLATASDNCGTATVTQDVTANTTFSTTTTVTLTATDGNSNTKTCTFEVSIEDNANPTAICQDVTVTLDASGNGTLTAAQVNNGSTDNCDNSLTLSLDQTAFDCSDLVGSENNNFALDFDGQNDFVLANTAPPYTGSTLTLEAWVKPESNSGNIVVVGWGGLSSSNAVYFRLINGALSFNIWDGSSFRTASTNGFVGAGVWTHIAAVKNGSQVDLYINGVLDNTGTVDNTPNVGYFSIGASYFQGGPNTLSPGQIDEVRVWNTVRTQSDIQNDMNKALNGDELNLAAYYNFEDGPNSSTLTDVTGNGYDATLNNMDSATDWITDIVSLPVTTTQVTLTVENDAGNTNNCLAAVTVQDNINPTITCPANQTETADVNCAGVFSDYTNLATAADNCGVPTITQSVTVGSSFMNTSTVTLTATDGAGGTATCTFDVSVADDIDPMITCPSDMTVDAAINSCAAIVNYTAPTGTDNCATGATTALGLGLGAGATFPLGTTTEGYTVTDAAGNTADCTFSITIEDNTAPTLTCPENITTPATSGAGATVTFANATATDNCTAAPAVTQTAGLTSGSAFPIGTNTVTFSATDDASQTNTCDLIIEVQGVAPSITCPDNISVNNDANLCSANVTFAATETQGVPTSTITYSQNPATDFVVGTTTVTATATNAVGSDDCMFTITVADAENPEITCPANITVDAAANSCDAVVNYTAPTGTDNCSTGLVTVGGTENLGVGATFPLGATTEGYTVTDAAGNTADCTFSITIEDNTAPVIADCPSNITLDNAPGTCAATASWTAPTVSDNCSSPTLVGSHTSGASFNVGTTTVTYDVADDAGNDAVQCSFTVTVNDAEVPTIICPTNITQITDATSCDAIVNYAAVTANDNCDGALTPTLDNGLASGAMFPVGTTTVSYTVADAAENPNSCSFEVTITDGTPPTVTCPADMDLSTALGNCNQFVALNLPTATDNCSAPGDLTIGAPQFDSGTTLSLISFPGFTVYLGNVNRGVHEVTWTAIDELGNVGSCTFNITVTDNESPVFTNCPTADVTADSDPAECGENVQWPNIFANDNCSYLMTSTAISGDFFDVGTTPVTFTATDEEGNATDCTFNVVVSDQTSPIAVCQDITVALDANGTYTLDAAELDNGSTDNCTDAANLVFTADLTALNCTHTGTAQTITLTVDDGNGNTTPCTSSVTVEDNMDPTAVCQDYTAVLDAAGNATVTMANIDNGSDDNCGFTLSISDGETSFDCADAGNDFVIELTNTDDNGNAATCNATVSVVDTEVPTITCPGDISLGTDDDVCNTVVTWSAPVTNDNCPNVVVNSNHNSGDTFPIGTTDVNYTVTDASGNQASCTFSVTIADDQAPNAICQNATIELDATGNASITTADIDNGSNDNCDTSPSLSLSETNFTCDDLPSQTVTLTVMDAAGLNNTCTATVTIEDNQAPVFDNCPTDITLPNTVGTCTAAATWPTITASDNCSTTITSSHNSGDVFPVGSTVVNYSVVDAANNPATCSFSVIIEDTELPTITCPGNITENNTPTLCAATATWTAPTGNDNCPNAIVTSTHNPGATFAVGENTVTYTITDAANNPASCSFTVTVVDNENPVIADCPSSMTLSNDVGQCSAVATWTAPTVSDNCGATISGTANSGDAFPVGTTTVTYTATDDAGNADVCSFDITVNDTENPAIDCPSDIVQDTDNGSCDAVVNYATPVGTDNCANATTTLVEGLASGSVFPIGETDVTYSVTDAAGNAVSCTFSVTIEDNEDPVIVNCPTTITQGNDTGNCSAAVTWTVPTVSDNCSATISGDATPGDVFPVGTTTVTYNAIDASNNPAVCTFDIIISDTEDPVITCPENIMEVNDMGNCDAVVTWDAVIASDNCPGFTVTSSPESGDVFPLGVTTVNYLVTDAAGNTAACNFRVTIEDSELPIMVCNDLTIDLDENGAASITEGEVNGGVTDNCTEVTNLTFSLDATTFDCAQLGENTVTLTATDEAENDNTCTATITVQDLIQPVISDCPTDMTFPALGSSCAGSGNWMEPTAMDNCTVITTTLDTEGTPITQFSGMAFGTFSGGVTTVTYTFTDGSGNPSVCTFDITVEDDAAPVITNCPSDITLSNVTGQCSAPALWTAPTIADNCSGVSVIESHNSGTVFPVGSTSVGYTATDAIGNTASCTFTVLIEDNEAPTIACPTAPISATSMGNCQYEVPNLNALLTVSDNCTNTMTGTQVPAAGAMITETTSVTFDVADNAGNPAQCVVSVTIPEMLMVSTTTTDATCPNSLDGSAQATITGGTAPISILWSNDVTTATNPGLTADTYTVMVTDANGCTATATAIVNGNDGINPDAKCQAVTLQLDENGIATLTTAQVNNNSTDNCSIADMTLSTETFGCSNLGANVVTLTVIDGSGNMDDCTAAVTVENPLAGIPDFCGDTYTLPLDEDGNAFFVVSSLGSHEDNCGPVQIFVNGAVFGCDDIGTVTPVPVTYINGNGQNVCSVNVEVEDVTAPVAQCKNFTLALDENGIAIATAEMANNNSSDNCGIQSLVISQTDFNCSNAEGIANEITLTVTDNFGLESSCTANVTVIDNILVEPDFCNTSQTVALDENGQAAFDPMANGPLLDNCGTLEAIVATGGFDCSNIGSNSALVFYYNASAIGSCMLTINVVDNTAPIASCKNATIVLDESGNATALASYFDNGSSDNCSIAMTSVSPNSFDCSNIGMQTVTLTVTDAQGLTSTCTAQATVIDNLLPPTDLICEETFELDLDNNGVASFDVNSLPSIMDNCGATLSVFPLVSLDFDCSQLGENTVPLYLYDANSLISCNMYIQVNDPTDACTAVVMESITNGDSGLNEVEMDGETVKSREDLLTENEASVKLLSVRAFPNPFKEKVAVEFNLNAPAHTKITVWNLQGRLVDSLVDRVVSSGNHRIFWTPQTVTSGIYLIRIKVENEEPRMVRVQLID